VKSQRKNSKGFWMHICRRAAFVFVVLTLLGQYETGRAQPPSSEPYVWRNVVMGGGGFVTGIIPHPRQKGLMYARTDVGGAYRWDDSAKRWIPITDWIGMADVNLTGIESLAVDPSDAKRVYLAAGIYSRGNAAILRSADQGRTWQRADVPFKMGGNESGRFNGERLAVDPNDGAILFLGSRRDGLWKSADRGATWRKVESFPTAGTPMLVPTNAFPRNPGRRFNFPPPQVGIVFVQFDPGSGPHGNPTPVIYAGVSVLETNLFRSTDGGVTWQAVPGQPTGLCPNHQVFSSEGVIYLSYGKEPGPNTMTDGAVWKFNTKNSEWTDITPIKPATTDQPFGYGAVAIDAAHPDTIVATTFCRWEPHDEIFRSTNGGSSWMPLLDKARFDYSFAPYTKAIKPHWMGSIQIDPFDANHILFTTGYGIWSCNNLTDADRGKPTQWSFADEGFEETVPLALISPPKGAHLISGLGDIDGFRHDDLDKSPTTGTFFGPHYDNTEDLAFAANKPEIIVRTGGNREGTNRIVHASISTDGGKTWSELGSEPTDSTGAGTIAISADGKTIVWTPRRSEPHYSVDHGTNWTVCAGLSSGVRVVADPVNPARFYAYDTSAGRVLISTNGANSFTPTTAALLAAADFPGGFGGGGGQGAVLSAMPGVEGNLWTAARSDGLYHSTDAGASFVKLGTVQEAYSLGFGKAAQGKKHPALYLAGKVGNIQALFRSDDDGESWVWINDDQHQYGWINHVTGDPRIFGRVYFATGGRGVIYGDRNSNKNDTRR
jgi:photosystem II stability/assembly factor-like uncharacterized protein